MIKRAEKWLKIQRKQIIVVLKEKGCYEPAKEDKIRIEAMPEDKATQYLLTKQAEQQGEPKHKPLSDIEEKKNAQPPEDIKIPSQKK